MGKIVAEVKELFGSGDHVTYDEAMRILEDSSYKEDEKRRLKSLYASIVHSKEQTASSYLS